MVRDIHSFTLGHQLRERYYLRAVNNFPPGATPLLHYCDYDTNSIVMQVWPGCPGQY
jgi:hypothetical protein